MIKSPARKPPIAYPEDTPQELVAPRSGPLQPQPGAPHRPRPRRIEIRDQLQTRGKIETRLRQLEKIDPDTDTTLAGAYRLSWLTPLIERDRAATHQIPSTRSKARPTPRRARHPPARRARDGPDRRSHPDQRNRQPIPLRSRSQIRALVRNRRRRALIRRRHRTRDPPPTRLRRQPTNQQRSLHRIRHTTTRPPARTRLHRPENRARQNTTRSTPSPQTTRRQPRHPPHVERRENPSPTQLRLTGERRTVPGST